MKRTLVSLVLTAALTASMLAGCGASTDSSTSQTTAAGTASTSAATSAETTQANGTAENATSAAAGNSETKTFENNELNIAVFEGGYGEDYWNAIVEAFEKDYPGVTVNMQISPTIADTIQSQIAAGNIPDFLCLNGTSYSIISTLITEKGLMDLTDVFDSQALDSDQTLRDEFTEGILDSSYCSPYGDGKIYQAPITAAPSALIYNKTLFEKYGWELPVTWDDFFALGEKAKEQGIALFTYQGIYPSYLQYFLLPAAESAGGEENFNKLLNYEENSVADSGFQTELDQFQKLVDSGYLMDGTVALNHTQAQQAFLQDEALFIPCGTWIESEMADSPRTDGFEYGMTPAPVENDGDTRYVAVALETMSIPQSAKNPELAKEFLKYLYTDQSAQLFAEKANGVLATKDTAEKVKDTISSSMYNFYSIYNEENVKATVISFAVQAQGSKIDLGAELWNPASDVVNGTMTSTEWGQSIEDAFSQIRSELEAAD
ncbi:carbohydrate ABC transporter substrate-binding protein [Oscillospiraceae bacterium HV4-5-C5C]|nr:carbohydrate ABC transporter substrate-binding protein [Oscillospiraceae bacterium HV4-5-C5C]